MKIQDCIIALRSGSHQLFNDDNNTELLKKILKEAFPEDTDTLYRNERYYCRSSNGKWYGYLLDQNLPTIKLSEVVEEEAEYKCEYCIFETSTDKQSTLIVECSNCKKIKQMEKVRKLSNDAIDLAIELQRNVKIPLPQFKHNTDMFKDTLNNPNEETSIGIEAISKETISKLHKVSDFLKQLVVIEEELNKFGVKITLDDSGFKI